MVASKVTDMDQTRVSGAASDRDRMGVPVRTPRLLLRRPTMADAAFHHARHSDPALYEHSPSAREVGCARLVCPALDQVWICQYRLG